jgi:outer membrane protein assembly factor BamB
MKLTKTLLLISGILLIFNCGEDGAPNQTSLESEDGTSRIIARYKVESDGYFYYNPPTLVNGYIYIGTSSKLETDALATDNCFIKLDINTNLCWKYRLGKNEVRGAAVVDSKGNVYFVVVEGRGMNCTRIGGHTYYQNIFIHGGCVHVQENKKEI